MIEVAIALPPLNVYKKRGAVPPPTQRTLEITAKVVRERMVGGQPRAPSPPSPTTHGPVGGDLLLEATSEYATREWGHAAVWI